MNNKITDRVYWIGAKDWNMRNFHGFLTSEGTTYNSYLIDDDQPTIIDTVKADFAEHFLSSIAERIPLDLVANIVCNHVELDHSGALPHLLRHCPNACVYTNAKGIDGLREHFAIDLSRLKLVKSGEILKIGSTSLEFRKTPMVHWPDSMMCYMPESRLLFSNDCFGQHLCLPEISDEYCRDGELIRHALKYYANIFYPYPNQIQKTLEFVVATKIDCIAPSHGLVIRSNREKIVASYRTWSSDPGQDDRAVIIYDTMWGSTEILAKTLAKALENQGIRVEIARLNETHLSDLIPKVLLARTIAIGSPTLHGEIYPSIAAFVCYLKGLKPRNKIGFVFGSYGWAGTALTQISESLNGLGWNLPEPTYYCKYVPGQADHDNLVAIATKLQRARF